jgi:hypothetical protein
MKIDYLPRALKALEEATGRGAEGFFQTGCIPGKGPSPSFLAGQEIRRIQRPMAGAYKSGLAFFVPHPKYLEHRNWQVNGTRRLDKTSDVGRPILAAACFQQALRGSKRAASKGGCSQDWPPYIKNCAESS